MEEQKHRPYQAPFCLISSEEGISFQWLGEARPTAEDELLVRAYLARKKVQGLDIELTIRTMRKSIDPFWVAESQPLLILDEGFTSAVDDKKMKAILQLLIPDETGQLLTAAAVTETLQRRDKVTFGINQKYIEDALSERDYLKEYTVAEGREPLHGVDGAIRYHFSTDHTLRPKELENGKVDYRELDLFDSCVPGQLLATVTAATDGIEGMSVLGKPLRAANGKRVKFALGKGTRLSEDGRGIYATINGRVDLVGGKVTVSENFEVAEDVDMSVGNIHFSGDVTIRGSVISGMRIRAGGNIEVHGIVESAHLEAEGDIILHSGMQGMNKGTVKAGGMIIARFIERATLSCQGTITADALIHCAISTQSTVTAAGKRGVLFGGQVYSPVGIYAQTLGSTFDAKTDLQIGLSPEHMETWAALAVERDDLEAQIEKENMLFTQLQSDSQMPMEKRSELLGRVAESKVEHKKQMNLLLADLAHYAALTEKARYGKIHVKDAVHPGTRITIAGASYIVREKLSYVTFLFMDGEVRYIPYSG